MASNTLLMRAMYARRMPKSAVKVTVATVVVNLCVSLALMPFFSYAGLAASAAIAFTCASIYGGFMLSKDLGEPLKLFDPWWLGKIFSSCALMSLSLLLFRFLLPYPEAASILARVAWVLSAIAASAAVSVAAAGT